ncbi:MAG: hypothetical protein WBP38_08515 [Hyphomicrobium sp.]|nr:hypothetical protein [Hyphomicrobium sp.]
MRLSTAGISAALILTGAALLAIAAAVGPSPNSKDSRVSIEGPVSALPLDKAAPVSF